MEASLSSSQLSASYLDYLNLLLLRPILAISFVLSLILFGWLLAWKLVLVHVPLVQEIFGLRKKPIKPKPPTRGRFSRFYNTIDAHNSNSQWSLGRADLVPTYDRCIRIWYNTDAVVAVGL
ncbi:hypothetical protein RHMOL_Rhmol06G0144700 [Rhododendron molle]|uniref:Uncharacterized protein n=2 Tax=Rhododendron molle TaxID=49168 RepID=A0ACC0NE75_RHOML|nr:hypothetical protein RHMOL_Rhmol06G0144700 [Rhododendron molle]KAI8550917.1 hypothetical protein RHMOL_Rhmol06G0144700 [Rhododendron molle]